MTASKKPTMAYMVIQLLAAVEKLLPIPSAEQLLHRMNLAHLSREVMETALQLDRADEIIELHVDLEAAMHERITALTRRCSAAEWRIRELEQRHHERGGVTWVKLAEGA